MGGCYGWLLWVDADLCLQSDDSRCRQRLLQAYKAASPIELLPLSVPTIVAYGGLDVGLISTLYHTHFSAARRRTPQCAVLLSFLFLPSFLFINHGHRMLIRVSNPIGMPDSRLLAWALIPVSRPQGRRRPDVAEYRLRHGRRGGAG